MRSILLPALFLCLLLFAGDRALAQSVNARAGGGAVATVETVEGENGVRLTIAVAGREPQVFDGVGDALVPLRANGRAAPVFAIDIDRDGVDEIFVRTSAQGKAGVLLVFRWDAASGNYAPVSFTEDGGGAKPYLMVDLAQPVSVNGPTVEVNHDKIEPGGRTRYRVSRYRWDGSGFAHSGDN